MQNIIFDAPFIDEDKVKNGLLFISLAFVSSYINFLYILPSLRAFSQLKLENFLRNFGLLYKVYSMMHIHTVLR